jgi:MFS family permease
VLGWALLADLVPIYPLYALLFTDAGLSGAQISALFAIWSGVAILTEVPSGALADRFSRRSCLVAACVLQAAGYAVWMLLPGFTGFALGFVLWGVGGSLVTGALEALLYDGLAAAGAADRYAQVNGWVNAVELLSQLPVAALATGLYATGGYALAGWASVGTCLAAAVVAARLPEPPRDGGDATDEHDEDDAGYLATLRAGVVEAVRTPAVLAVLVAAAGLTGFDAVEEYFTLVLADWGLPVVLVPLADVPIVLAGALGAAVAGSLNRAGPWLLAGVLAVSMLLFGGAGLAGHPAGLAAVAVFYGGYRAVIVVVDARLQERIASRSRATVTSVASVGGEVAAFAVYGAWALGEVPAVAVFGLAMAAALPLLLRVGVTRTREAVPRAEPEPAEAEPRSG